MLVLFPVDYCGDDSLGMMRISSILKGSGHQVEAVDAEYGAVMNKLKQSTPAILAYSTPTLSADKYLSFNRVIKEKISGKRKLFSVFGGPHPTAVPGIVEEEGVDAVCVGEGEFAMEELAGRLGKGENVRNIRNLWVKEDGRIFKNPVRPLIEDLDRLPLPDRDLFSSRPLFDKEKIHIITGRGCPYACAFCFHSYYNQIYENKAAVIRKRAVENDIEEIRFFRKKHPLKFVLFDDDIFVLPRGWLKEFSVQYPKRVGLPFFCNVRADLISEETADYLKKAGCHSISMGIETADDFLRNKFLNKNLSKERIVRAARLIKERGIKLKTSNIVGIPGGCVENDLETLRLNRTCRADYTSVSPLVFYPKTEIVRTIGEKKGRLSSSGKKFNLQRREINNLRYLFAVAVEYYCFFYFIRILIALPFTKMYRAVYLFWEGYCAYFRLYPSRAGGFRRGVRRYLNILLKKSKSRDKKCLFKWRYPDYLKAKNNQYGF